MNLKQLPKAILHEHIEGSVTPDVAKILAERHNVALLDDFFYGPGEFDEQDFPNGRYRYDESDFLAFIATYDSVANLVRDPEDYYLVVKDFLTRNARKGMVYCEIITSAFHLCFDENKGDFDEKKYHAIMDMIEMAINEVNEKYGTVTRLQACGVRHLNKAQFNMSMDFIEKNPRQMITGFNIAGNEMVGKFEDFSKAHLVADIMNLPKSYHAGEICGSESINEAVKFGASRIGHGIRAINDERVIDMLIRKKITLEISPTSNRILVAEMNQSLDNHPLRQLYDKGVRLSINTDDAGLFGTDIDKEYKIAMNLFRFKRVELLDVTLCALEAAFIDDKTKDLMINTVYSEFSANDWKDLENLCNCMTIGPLQSRLLGRLLHRTK